LKGKTLAILIAAILTISIGASTMLIPSASAHTPPWQIPTYAYIVTAPNPIGVGQTALIYMWLDPVFGVAGGTTAAVGTNGYTASAALLSNNYRFHNYKLTITAPDGTSTTQTFATISDPTSNQYTRFTPSQTGTYTLKFDYPGEAYGVNGNGYQGSVLINDTYLPSSASTTLTVQQTPIPAPITSYPLPQQYWSHPIYGENTDWWAISSNWLGQSSGPTQGYGGSLNSILFHPDGVGPLTPHVMWTRPLQFGGVVGGNPFIAGGTTPGDGSAQGAMYYEGSSYQPRFSNPIIINGILFYTQPVSFTGPSSGPETAVDIRTGQVLWSRSDVPPISFGLIFNVWDQDQHGTFPPILFTSNYAQAFDAYTGNALFNVTGVPAGTNIGGPSGENLKYVFSNAGNASNPQWYLAEWNSSKLWQYDINPYTGGGSVSPSVINATNGALCGTLPIPLLGSSVTLPTGASLLAPYGSSITVNANIPINSTTVGATLGGHGIATYDWNISIPTMNTMPPPYSTVNAVTGQLVPPAPGANPVVILAAKYGDVLLCRNGSLPVGFAATQLGYPQLPYTYFTINLNASKGAIGNILWMKTYNPPAGNVTLLQSSVDFGSRVFVLQLQETIQFQGYSLDDGSLLWTTPPQNSWNYYFDPGQPTLGTTAYGKFYNAGFGGVLYCYDDKTGKLLWTYGNGGEGNSTYGGLQISYGTYPTELQFIANGVVYIASDEHTIPNPIYKGATLRAVNATDGAEIWQLSLYPSEWTFSASTQMACADGFITTMNGLDNNIYSIGQGPSTTAVQAPQNAITAGNSVMIQGTVMDVSAGTTQATQKGDFPKGVPVASDASMKDWMGYVYQQKPEPTNFTGVPVSIDAIDPNGNYIHIGTAITNEGGFYYYNWETPNIPGSYLITATFAGTNGYWGSNAQTAMTIQNAPVTPAPTASPVSGLASTGSLELGIAAVIIVIIIIGAILAILLMRKRP